MTAESDSSEALTGHLNKASTGDPHALELLIEAVHSQLRKIAGQMMQGEASDHTLQASALVNEAYLRLFGKHETGGQAWHSRRHFFCAAAETMRRILVDHARKKKSLKRGGECTEEPLQELHLTLNINPDETLRVDEALAILRSHDELAAEVVRLRYFLGLSNDEIAEVLHVSRSSIYEHWAFARAWMIDYIKTNDPDDPTANGPLLRP